MSKKVKLTGYNDKKESVYDGETELAETLEEPGLWNDARKVVELGLSFLQGKIYDNDGEIYEEFERAFDPQSGEIIGSKISRNNGGVETDGIYSEYS